MQLFNLILTNAKTTVHSILIGLVGEDIVTELNTNVIESFKGIYLADYWILWLFVFGVALEENEYTAVLLLKALPEKDLVYVHIFLLLTHHFEPYTLRI
jgi:hypothetical protein